QLGMTRVLKKRAEKGYLAWVTDCECPFSPNDPAYIGRHSPIFIPFTLFFRIQADFALGQALAVARPRNGIPVSEHTRRLRWSTIAVKKAWMA
ncbi:MAG: hypothetical protein NZ765_08955, partial [Anaerolineae bacterium]|nr:hypothetical protein [Anaerolineae bacterium]MDW8071720.1 hypothetical protein [Anaerolineae bacterium]